MIPTPQVRFTGRGAFHAELQQRAQDFFEGSSRSRHGGWRIGVKIAVMLSWLAASWALAVFAPLPAWALALLAVSIGFAMAGVGFCAMHDANHGATSSSARVNRIVSLSLDLVGASSVLWREKHNVRHHTYTNIAGGGSSTICASCRACAPATGSRCSPARWSSSPGRW